MRLAGKIQPDNRKFSGDSTREIKTIAPCRAPILRPIWRYRPSKVSRAIYEGGRNQTPTGYRRRYILYVREAFGCLGWVACNADTRLLLYGGDATSTIPNSVQVNEFADANRIQSNCSK